MSGLNKSYSNGNNTSMTDIGSGLDLTRGESVQNFSTAQRQSIHSACYSASHSPATPKKLGTKVQQLINHISE